jgi:hypothetical protein
MRRRHNCPAEGTLNETGGAYEKLHCLPKLCDRKINEQSEGGSRWRQLAVMRR